jgi:hypothetical protein
VATLVLVGVIAIGVVVLPFLAEPGPPENEGRWIVGQLEAYKAEHGTYPPDLATAGISPVPNPNGEWAYSPSPNLSRFGMLIWSSSDGSFIKSYDQERGWQDHRKRSD